MDGEEFAYECALPKRILNLKNWEKLVTLRLQEMGHLRYNKLTILRSCWGNDTSNCKSLGTTIRTWVGRFRSRLLTLP